MNLSILYQKDVIFKTLALRESLSKSSEELMSVPIHPDGSLSIY